MMWVLPQLLGFKTKSLSQKGPEADGVVQKEFGLLDYLQIATTISSDYYFNFWNHRDTKTLEKNRFTEKSYFP